MIQTKDDLIELIVQAGAAVGTSDGGAEAMSAGGQ